MKKVDLIVLAAVLVFLLILWAAPDEDFIYVPYDDSHEECITILRAEGKKATEKYCEECHSPDTLPLSENHPPKYRCLFCHKLAGPESEQKK
jgi:hypothetical protein